MDSPANESVRPNAHLVSALEEPRVDEMFARFITETIRGENRVLTVFTVIKNDGEEVLTSEVQAIARRLYAEFHPEGAR